MQWEEEPETESDQENAARSPIAPPFSPIFANSPKCDMECSVEHGANEIDEIGESPEVQQEQRNVWCGLKIVGDNIDKNI